MEFRELNNKFKSVESDMDSKRYLRSFSGRMTKGRYKLISAYVRCLDVGSYGYCGHEWDCCGCECARYADFDYKHNRITINVTVSYNY